MRIKPLALLVIAVLGAGCGGTVGERQKRLTPTQGIVVSDAAAADVEILPAFVCSTDVSPLNCATPASLRPDGHVTDFSYREWNGNTGKWCDESGFHGSIYSYTNTQITADTHAQRVDPDGTLHLVLSVSSGQYGGGGLAFEGGCLDVSAFTGVQFTVALASGNLTACPLQLQLQTFDQRPTTQTPAGGCDQNTTSCYNFPAATNIAVTSMNVASPTFVALPFSSFSKISGALTQVVGLQWQVNASGACMVDLSFGNIAFIPAPPTPEPGGDGGAGAATD